MNKNLNKLLWGATAVIALVSIYFVTVFSFWLTAKNRIYPGITVAGVKLSGKTKEEAIKILEQKGNQENKKEILYDGDKLEGLEITFKSEETAQKAIEIGKNNPFILGFKQDIPADFTYNEENFYKALSEKEKKIKKAVKNSRLISNESIEVVEGEKGVGINYSETAQRFYDGVSHFNNSFKTAEYSVQPTFTGSDLSERELEINNIVPEEFTIEGADKEFKVTKKDIVEWTTLSGQRLSYSKNFYGEEYLEPIFGVKNDSLFSNQLVADYLNEISKNINTIPVNAVLGASEGKVIISKNETDGKELVVDESTDAIIKALENKETNAKLEIKTKKAEIRSDNLEELGLIELVSTGSSNFSGSPANRIHNISTGASKFNGVLIKPDQEFSFNTTLGPVDASTGYLPELVILENKTQPQFGGGLCQVSSTAFRAALNAGFPITQRKAHAYPVSYYKPFGVDATIYLPSPDLRFKNDSGKYIFIQTRIVGKNLYFDFYGTKPKRTITFAGNEAGTGGVFPVEKVTPLLYDQGVRGNASFTAVIFRFITDSNGKTTSAKWISKYDSPDKYPH